jgi:hypothetical protein
MHEISKLSGVLSEVEEQVKDCIPRAILSTPILPEIENWRLSLRRTLQLRQNNRLSTIGKKFIKTFLFLRNVLFSHCHLLQ